MNAMEVFRVRGCCGVVFRHMFGGVLEGGGSARGSGVSSSPVTVIVISLENSSICFFTTSCRLELSLFCICVGNDNNLLSLVS